MGVVGALIAAKAKRTHGEWLPWLAEKCPEISDDSARNYMKTYDRAASNPEIFRNLDSMTPTAPAIAHHRRTD